MTVFYKYQAAGNDFIIIDSTEAYSHGKGEQYLSEWQACATRICHRRFGVGADGILLVSRLMGDNFDIKVDIINSDGSLAEMCGNGMRCVARYLSDILSVSTGAWRVETLGGIQFIRLQASCEFPIEVRMARVELGGRSLGWTKVYRHECECGESTFCHLCGRVGGCACVGGEIWRGVM